MIFKETPLNGSYLIDLDKFGDDRGFFARVFCAEEFEKHSLDAKIIQVNNSLSKDKGTLRGLHYQLAPKAETKIVRCIKGSIFDVILDMRKDSKTSGQWFGDELTSENRTMMYVPKGFAHGIITLEDNTEIIYLTTEVYAPDLERGIRWNDPEFNIKWPIKPTIISDKDKNARDFDPDYHLA